LLIRLDFLSSLGARKGFVMRVEEDGWARPRAQPSAGRPM